MRQILIIGLMFSISIGVLAEKKKKDAKPNPSTTNTPTEVRTNLHDFMEDYTKPAMKYFKKTGKNDYLTKIIREVPSLAIAEEKADWQKIVDESLNEGKPENSCKSCHDDFKKEYKKKNRKREILVPQSLVGLDKEIRKALK